MVKIKKNTDTRTHTHNGGNFTQKKSCNFFSHNDTSFWRRKKKKITRYYFLGLVRNTGRSLPSSAGPWTFPQRRLCSPKSLTWQFLEQ